VFDANGRTWIDLVVWHEILATLRIEVRLADDREITPSAASPMFANSSSETNTTTEKGFIDGFAKQVGDIGSIMTAILVAVLAVGLLAGFGLGRAGGGSRVAPAWPAPMAQGPGHVPRVWVDRP
jgi:hypothetical protein